MKLKLTYCIIAAWMAWGAASLRAVAPNPGDEVVVVYNTQLPESKAVAEHYAARRRVPPAQVLGFEVSTNEEITRAEFRDSLQHPLTKALDGRKLWSIRSHVIPATSNQVRRIEWKPSESKIRYLVLCYGVPLKIAPDANLKEEGADRMRPEMRRNEAAVDSELALLPLVEEHLPLSGPLRNFIFGTTNLASIHPTNGVLMVARLDGPSPAIARGLVDKALQAETNGLWGRAYFDLRNTTDPAYKMGDDWIHNAAEICRRLGFETVVDDAPGTFPAGFPMSQIAFYLGWYEENACGPFAQPTVEFMPGAFAYHLHSFSGVTVRSAERAWVGPLLAKGATATMGSVYEPYLAGTPEVAIFTVRWIYQGATFGEAAYASQPVLSWQTTVVGDPLYRPFGQIPEQLQDRLQQERNPLVEWSFLRLLNLNLASGKPLQDVVALLEQLNPAKTSAVLTEKLGDLYFAQGKPSAAAFAYSQALKLEPSPEQSVRLHLLLGERLTALDRPMEAYDHYLKLLQSRPEYPDKLALYRRLLPLAQKLDKKADAENYEAEIKRLSPPPPKS